MTKSNNDSRSTSSTSVIGSPKTDTDKLQEWLQSSGSDPMGQELLRNMRRQSTDPERRRELGHRLV